MESAPFTETVRAKAKLQHTATQRNQSRQQKNHVSNGSLYEVTALAVRGRGPICEMVNRGENIGGSVSILQGKVPVPQNAH